ncbi:MAG: carboxypeptidase regulatory-like domain-containing protein, partial [Promethearchaeota archaeon]
VELYNWNNELVRTGTTNDFGFYEFTTLECGVYQVTVSAPHFFSQTQEVKIRWNNDTRILSFPLDSKQGNTFIQVVLTDQYDQLVKGGVVKLYDFNQNFVRAGLTDDSGFLNLSDISIDIYDLEISKSGYQTKWFFNMNPVNLFNNLVSHKLVPSTGTGVLNVFCPSNSFITVSNHYEEVLFSGFSSTGTFKLQNLAVDDYSIEIFTDEGTIYSGSSINWMGDVNSVYIDQVTEQLDTSGYMEFTVYEFNVGPIPNCYVTAKSQYDVYYSQVTDVNGFANITGLHIGEYEITVQHSGFVDTVVVHSIDYAGDSSKASIYLYRATFDLELYIIGAVTGLPLRGSVSYKFNAEPYCLPQLTDWNGFIRYNNLPVGQYKFCITAYGYETQFQTFSFMTNGDFQVLHFSMIKYGGNGVEDHFAIILGGGTEDRFTHDARGMYLTLTNHYGFTPENTYLLTCETVDWVSNVPVPYDAITSLSSLTWAVNEIASKADIEDEVLIWWTGHGGYYRSETTGEILDVSFNLNGDFIAGTYFNTLIEGITCNRMYFFLGPCHSGYWIQDLWGKGNRVIYTSCDWDEIARAFYEHSYWPRATKRTLDPAYDADEADWNNDNRVSLKELYDYAVYWVRIVKNKDQHPQRWVSYGQSDSVLYIGDETYNAGLGATTLRSSIQYNLADYSIKEETHSLDEKTGISTCVSVGLLDDELDNDDCFINIYNSSTFPGYSPIADVTFILRFLNGTVFTSGTSNIDGTINFYDLPDGEFAWEAIYDDQEIGSGRFIADGVKLAVDTLTDNYDRQGDAADLQVQITDQTEATPLMGMTVSLYHFDGTFIGNKTSDFNGIAMFYDLSGIFGYEVFYQDILCAEGTIAIDSSHFTLSTDLTAPEMTILSPTDGRTYYISDLPIELQYEIVEENNYTLTVFLNTVDIGHKFSGSELGEILASGAYTIRIEAVDFVGNLGYGEVSFTVTDDISITTTNSGSRPFTTSTETTNVTIYWHLELLQVVCCILLTLVVRKRRSL